MFDFFGLSRELRDRIYDLSLDKQVILPAPKAFRMQVNNAPSRNLMLVSRQFNQEYLDAVRRRTSIVYVDDGSKPHRFPREEDPVFVRMYCGCRSEPFLGPNAIHQAVELIVIPTALRSIRRLDYRFWTVSDHPRWLLEFHIHTAMLKRIAAQIPASSIFMLIGLLASSDLSYTSMSPIDEFDAFMIPAGLYGYRQLADVGSHELLIAKKFSYHDKSEPLTMARYEAATDSVVELALPEGKKSWKIEDFGFDGENDGADW